MAKRKTIPKYGKVIMNGIEYFRTRILDADGAASHFMAEPVKNSMIRLKRLKKRLKNAHLGVRSLQLKSIVRSGCLCSRLIYGKPPWGIINQR